MVQLSKVRAAADLDQKVFAEKIGFSRATVARIELAEREQSKHPMALRTAMRLAKGLHSFFNREVAVEELEGITIAPPRPGRPKKVSNKS